MKKKSRIILVIAVLVVLFIVCNNSLIFNKNHIKRPRLLAHRGLAQTFDIETVKWDTNTAAIIYKPEHDFIENTLPSMKAAFSYGADIVEFDIRVTKDKELAVFHDYLVDSRTEKKGMVSDYTLAELQKMDVGYGYTHDNGSTYPLRSKGIGLMPSFNQVIEEFPGNKFLVHIKDNGPEIGMLLLDRFNAMSESEVKLFSIYGNDEAIAIIREKYPDMKALTAKLIKKAILQYELIGWTGYIPKSIRNMEIHLPIEYAAYVWGWPEKFVMRMNKVNSRVVIVKKKGPWSGGFDTSEDIAEIPDNYFGYIWTERIDKTGKYIF